MLKSPASTLARVTRGQRLASTDVATKLQQKVAELDDPQRQFEYQHQRTIGLTTVPHAAPRSAKLHAEAVPWNGEEGTVEASSRMLQDAIKPLKISRSQRLSNARENVLDYTLNAAEGPTHNERLVSSKKARRISRGPATSGLSSGGWIESIAGQEIENAVRRGQFRNIARGELAEDSKQGLVSASRNPELDFTEYLMNNILKKQGGAPPWIMKQVAVREAIDRFRDQIRFRLQERLVHRVVACSGNGPAAIKLARSGEYTKDLDWEQQYEGYHREMVEQLNQRIRGYNLQAPATARRGYLRFEDEINLCYDHILDGIEDQILRFVGANAVPKADRHDLHSSLPPIESADKHYGFKQLLQDMFRKKK